MRRRMVLVVAAMVAGSLALARAAVAEGLFDFFFGGAQKAGAHSQFLCRSIRPQPAAGARRRAARGGLGSGLLRAQLRRKYFPVTSRGNATPLQMCQAFCPATATKVYYGSNIDWASASDGERYASSENAFAYRKALRADCTCNGRDPAGLSPVDLTLDGSLRPGDVVATSGGLVAYTGVKVGNGQTAEFTPVASYPGLTADVRARLGEMKVAPVSAEMVADSPLPEAREVETTASIVPKNVVPKAKRAELR